ncbi:enoyl-CoA hydratase/isomerase family protein, partial [Dietzia sp. SLG510A3-40A3]|nr:enoyl-CoA hydratase/isomerase family protein [Dietzia sp. SLG510A3-40A3]
MTATGRDAIKVDHDDLGVTTISINRPDRMNALDHPIVTALTELIIEHGSDPGTRVIVLSGEGGAFTTGTDLQAIKDAGADAPSPDATMAGAAALVRAVLTVPVPVIAA